MVQNFVAEHAYPSQSLMEFALQNQGEFLILEGVGTFNLEILVKTYFRDFSLSNSKSMVSN